MFPRAYSCQELSYALSQAVTHNLHRWNASLLDKIIQAREVSDNECIYQYLFQKSHLLLNV